jgi:hypothetical protein
MGKAADLLLQVWNDPNRKLGSLPDDLRPGNLAHAYGIQQAVSRGLGAIGGWTISRSEALDSLVCAPLPLASIHLSPTCLASGHWTYRRLVPRICFRLGACLPDYDAPYSDDRIIAAIESCHVAIEVRQPRFADAHALDAMTALADSNGYRCLVYSRQGLSWQSTAPLHGEGRIIVGSKTMPAGIMETSQETLGALRWLANHASRWAGGLMVGHLVTVAARTQEIDVPADVPIRVMVDGLGNVDMQFNSDERRVRPVDRNLRRFWTRWREYMQG